MIKFCWESFVSPSHSFTHKCQMSIFCFWNFYLLYLFLVNSAFCGSAGFSRSSKPTSGNVEGVAAL